MSISFSSKFPRRPFAALATFVAAGLLSPPVRGAAATKAPNAPVTSAAYDPLARGQAHFDRGDFVAAASSWSALAAACEKSGNVSGRLQALTALGAAYQSAGQLDEAQEVLQSAFTLAKKSGAGHALALVQNNLGSVYAAMRQTTPAMEALNASIQIAGASGDSGTGALALNNLGNLLASLDRDQEAQDCYIKSQQLARGAQNVLLEAQASINLATNLARNGRGEGAAAALEGARHSMGDPQPSHAVAQLWLSAAHTQRSLADGSPETQGKFLALAATLDNSAVRAAESIGDQRSLSQGLGALGEIEEKSGHVGPAVNYTRRARFVAQSNQYPDLLYQWDWQMGRLLKADGKPDEAINAYRRALETLRTLCDCNGGPASGAGSDPHSSFRDTTGPIYYQMADLLLQRSATPQGEEAVQKRLAEARDTVELLKSAELSDYFQDDCVTAGLAKVKDIDSVLKSAAVVYYIPLPDRTEILLGLPSGLQRFTVPIKSGALMARVRRFRLQLERPGTDQYLSNASDLYDLLLRPMENALNAANVKTLIFVPDGALRTVPLAVLYDGKQFLIEKFAVAVTPGLTLMDPRPLDASGTTVFAGGISEAVQGYEALDGVPAELGHIATDYPTKPLLNRDFQKSAIQHDITDGQYSIVHIASHGEFSSNPQKTYLLTYDGKLTLDDLENVIRPHQYQGHPVELLVLSACQTAAGDDRAALGLAGVALKSGARSVMATLWSVSDDATSQLVQEFYAEIKRDPTQSKAIALQKAQIALLRQDRFRHPAFWAPYLLIGNWL